MTGSASSVASLLIAAGILAVRPLRVAITFMKKL